MKIALRAIAATAATLALCHCSSSTSKTRGADVVVSVKDQKLGIYNSGQLVGTYRISTSKFGVGDRPGSNCTPLGKHEVVAKIGHGLPPGAVLKSRQWNGEVIKPNAPGRDPIVSRILWLSGCERSNCNAYGRFIYIHGTPEESRLGTPASYGCVRMAMRDVIRVFERVPIGSSVVITQEGLPAATGTTTPAAPVAPAAVAAQQPAPAAQPVQQAQPAPASQPTPAPAQQRSPSDRPLRIKLNGITVAHR
jgi:hypothetical protein